MSTPFSAVVSFHLNPSYCGVARWNQALSKKLGVPCVGLSGEWGAYPLVSLKWSEFCGKADALALLTRGRHTYAVLWHDAGDELITARAKQAWWAFQDGLWCPPAPLPTPSTPAVRVFSFGMGHKLQTAPYRKVDALIASRGHTYDVRVSIAIHEGSYLGDVSARLDGLRRVVGRFGAVKILGALADDALAEELHAAHAVCAFFADGVRPNNTSVWTAMRAGCPVVTNLDDQSPPDLIHGVTCFDIARLTTWPSPHLSRVVGAAGQSLVRDRYGDWDVFVRTLCAS